MRAIVDFRADAIAARDLDPGALYEILAYAGPQQKYRLTEPIPMRRQDFDIVCGWISTAEAGWTDEDIALANTAVSDG